MIVNHVLVEPSLGGYVPVAPFALNGTNSLHEVLRLLNGSVNILNETTGKTLCLTTDELRFARSRTAKPDILIAKLFDDSVNLEEYASFSEKISRRNASFFRQLQRELVLCLVCKKTRRYTESFLYLYRILEFVSIAFPLIYASAQRGFAEGHSFLRSLLLAEKESELKVLEIAIPVLIRGTELELYKFDFSVAGSNLQFVSALKTQLISKIAPSVKDISFENDGDTLFSVPFASMSSLMVSLRNRMFHYKIGQKNIDLGDLGGAERILEICLAELVYWFGLTFVEIVRALARQEV